MSAYSELHLEEAECDLGEFLDYMVRDLKVNMNQASGVSLRMIQLYEQGQNNLSKAQANVVKSLAKKTACRCYVI